MEFVFYYQTTQVSLPRQFIAPPARRAGSRSAAAGVLHTFLHINKVLAM